MSLLDECIEALGENVRVLSDNKRKEVIGDFECSFPITEWGRIKWDKETNYADVNTVDEIIFFLNQNIGDYSKAVYIIWDEGTLPVIKSDLNKVLEVIDDVTAVSFDTWIFSPSSGFVVEIFHDGEVKVGLKYT
ncbi:hypothetical protein E4665_16550 [Sporolactobacillus shoreae]|uniref:Uncharacterized protein n=1 Tax=Sporolactobacillus shoreae TaxID=1465501 RepID=A0A4Z0GHG8_9BACL|nr:hypothetical protein [Sporolactobacillus shoreae]TGA96119.1 hypothetical protein E4665_16550 [Sporolactobacillus shoreae]